MRSRSYPLTFLHRFPLVLTVTLILTCCVDRIKTDSTTVYRCGPLIDLCRGPHVRHTGKIKSFMVTKSSSA